MEHAWLKRGAAPRTASSSCLSKEGKKNIKDNLYRFQEPTIPLISGEELLVKEIAGSGN